MSRRKGLLFVPVRNASLTSGFEEIVVICRRDDIMRAGREFLSGVFSPHTDNFERYDFNIDRGKR